MSSHCQQTDWSKFLWNIFKSNKDHWIYYCSENPKNITAGFQSETQTTCAFSNPIVNNTGTTESALPGEGTEVSFPTSSTPISIINKPLQVPTKTIRSSFHII